MKNVLIVYNPNSGKGLPIHILKAYYETLLKNGYNADMMLTERPHHATEIVENADNYDIVLSIGGDGTLNEVVRGNAKRKQKMAVCPIPTGSCNDVASMLGYNQTPMKNLEMAITGKVKCIDIGTINNQPFTYVVGMGKFMNIPYETSRNKKSKLGYFAYIKEGIKEIFDVTQGYQAEVQVDGINLEDKYSLIMISNSNHIAGLRNFYKNTLLDDEKLEVLLCKSKHKENLVLNLIRFYLGMHPKDIISIKAKDIKIKLKDIPEKHWCIDGERLSYNTDEYHISAHEKMNFIVPKQKIKRLFKEENAIN